MSGEEPADSQLREPQREILAHGLVVVLGVDVDEVERSVAEGRRDLR